MEKIIFVKRLKNHLDKSILTNTINILDIFGVDHKIHVEALGKDSKGLSLRQRGKGERQNLLAWNIVF